MHKKALVILSLCLIAATLGSCAKYSAVSLNAAPAGIIYEALPSDGLIVAAKAFSKNDCKKYLDRNVLNKGFQPIQLYIENVSERAYLFSTNRVNLTLASPEDVARKVHTSTLGRITGYGAAALFATPLFIIPAVVDGIQSSRANTALDHDFVEKAAKDQVIAPYSHCNMLLFVPIKNMQETFVVTLLDEETSKPKRVIVRIKKNEGL